MQFIPCRQPSAVRAPRGGYIRSQIDIFHITGYIFVQDDGGDGTAILQLHGQSSPLPKGGMQDYSVIKGVDAVPMLEPEVGCHMYLNIANYPLPVHFYNGVLEIAARPGATPAGMDNLYVIPEVILQTGD
jgi:hypothetical protein